MNNKSALLLSFSQPGDDKNNLLLKKICVYSNVIYAECALYNVNIFLRILRRFCLTHGWPFVSSWLYKWKNDINKYDTVICIASCYSPVILKWVKKKAPNIRCINYYWDSIEVSGYPVVRDKAFENWTFSKDDALKYGMRYNPQFFVESLKLPQIDNVYDVTYVGADREGKLKSRTELVKRCYELFQKAGLKSLFYYVTEDKTVPGNARQSSRMTEVEFYNASAQGRAILDLVEPDIKWMTLRPLLALSNEKKLITNNTEIMNEPFYSTNNVFVLGVDDINSLQDFVNGDFNHIDKDIIDYYNVDQWYKRFCIQK